MNKAARCGISPAPGAKSPRILLLGIVAICLVLGGTARRACSQEIPGSKEFESKPTQLKPGDPIDSSLAPDGKQSFEALIAAGQYAEIEVKPSEVMGLSVVLEPARGQPELFANTGFGNVSIPLLAAQMETFRLDIQRFGKIGGEGRFSVSLSSSREAQPEDQTRINATREFGMGERLYSDRSASACRERLTHYQKALELWQQLGDKRQETLALMRIGQVDGYIYDHRASVEYLQRALAASQASAFLQAEAAISMSLGNTYADQSDKENAVKYLRRSLELSRAIHHKLAEANALLMLADDDDSVDALDYYQQALRIYRELKTGSGEAYILKHIGESYLSRGRQQEGMDTLRQGLEESRTTGDGNIEGAILLVLASGYGMEGDLRQALECYAQALKVEQTQGDTRVEGDTLLQMGSMYLSLGELEKARDYSRQALARLEKVQDRLAEANGLLQVGRVHSELGESETARADFRKALALEQAISNPLGEADALNAIGDSYRHQGRFEAALENYQQALANSQKAPHQEDMYWGSFHGEADILKGIGSVQISLNHAEEASKSLNRALEVLPTAGHTTEDEAEIFYQQARAERALGHQAEALARIKAALELTEQLRGTVAGADLRASYLARVRDRYELLIAVLMQLNAERPGEGYDAKGLEASERARARALLDLLSESHAEIREGVDPGLLERERSLGEQLSFKAAYRITLLSKNHKPQQTAALEKEIGELTARYGENEARIRAQSPRYADLTQPRPLTSAEVQRLLDPDTALLEYSLGGEQSFLWVVTTDALESLKLPPRSRIEALAKQAYAELSASNSSAGQQATLALARLLLGRANAIGAKRLAIVADGALEYIPFAALRTSAHSAPLAAKHEVVNLPSASTLHLLRMEIESRPRPPMQVAVLADPVFTSSDPRVTGKVARAPLRSGGGELERSLKETGMLRLDRLPATRREAQNITALAPDNASLLALDFKASRETASSPELGQYRIVHFASHTLMNTRHPELSGIVLSLVDKDGRPQDGFLQSHQIFNLKLNADMVVLSACQTALGKEVRGEGLIGLTRAFMYAGAPRVVASLWKVPDQATAELMGQFYRALFSEGLSPAAALRKSQLAMRQDKRWAAPYYWAGFALQGDWR